MGNCLQSQAKVVRIVKTDGKILEYRACIKVNEVLSAFKGHALSAMLPVQQYLEQDTELIGGVVYYLIPLPSPSPKAQKKKVTFSEPEIGEAKAQSKKASLTIKLVISKGELQEMLETGVISFDRTDAEPQQEEYETEEHSFPGHGSQAWKPNMEAIPEFD